MARWYQSGRYADDLNTREFMAYAFWSCAGLEDHVYVVFFNASPDQEQCYGWTIGRRYLG